MQKLEKGADADCSTLSLLSSLVSAVPYQCKLLYPQSVRARSVDEQHGIYRCTYTLC